MIIRYPLSTEKSIRLADSENTLIFVVDTKAKKADIKNEIESLYKAKVKKIRTMIDTKGRKKAYIVFTGDKAALDLATELGLL